MTKGLAALARRAAQARQVLVVRGGGGGPLAQGKPPAQPLLEEDELLWDDGTANPEPALDKFTLVSSGTALAWVAGGLGFFACVGTAQKLMAPAERRPWVDKQVMLPPQVVAAQEAKY